MPKVTNPVLAGKVTNVAGALLKFNKDGEAEATDAQAEVLLQVPGFEIEKPAKAAKAEPKAEPEAEKADAKKSAGKKAAADKE